FPMVHPRIESGRDHAIVGLAAEEEVGDEEIVDVLFLLDGAARKIVEIFRRLWIEARPCADTGLLGRRSEGVDEAGEGVAAIFRYELGEQLAIDGGRIEIGAQLADIALFP